MVLLSENASHPAKLSPQNSINIGGSVRNLHASQRRKLDKWNNKTAVLGVLERSDEKNGSKVLLEVIDSENQATVARHIRNRVKKGAAIYPDAHGAYLDEQAK